MTTCLRGMNKRLKKSGAAGTIRWLRPDYQNPTGTTSAQTSLTLG